MSSGIRRKLFFQGKIFYCSRCHRKNTFHEGCPSEQEDEVQWNKVEQKGAALEQPTIQVGPETTSGDGSELESDCPSADDETQQQPNAMAKGEQLSEANETAACNQERETFTVIPPTPIKNQRLNTGKSLHTRDAQKGNGNAVGGSKNKKGLGSSKSGCKKS